MLNEISHKPYVRELYEARFKAVLDYNNDIQEAREEGRDEGREEGKIAVLIELGASKFGELPFWAEDKIRHATAAQIQQWSKTILRADSLDGWLGE